MQPPSHNKKEEPVENKNSLPYPSRTLDPPFTLVDRAKEIEQANQSIQSHVNARLDIILRQIHSLQAEAKKVIEQANEDLALHKVKCNFEKKPFMTIHLYERSNLEKFFSLLSPREWSSSLCRYLGSYQINPDQSFKKMDDETKDKD